ncbi:MAG: hypothetical protein ACYSR0_10365 [Planctomycetota bacterium]|jgi:hypothetical protein
MKVTKHGINNSVLYLSVFILITAGIGSVLSSFPYLYNNIHDDVSLIRSYETDNPKGHFVITYKTKDAFVAGNPINVTIMTGNMKEFEHIELQFIGSEQYVIEYYNYSNTSIDNLVDIQNKLQSLSENILKTHVALEKKSWIEYYDYFEGNINDVIYSSGGDFDIGLTVKKEGELLKGYLMGDNDYVIREAIHISPYESMISIETNRIMIGLSWIGIGIALLIAGLSGFLNILNDNRNRYSNKK